MAASHCWVVFAPTTKAGKRAVHPWQVRERDGTAEGIFRGACKTEAAAGEICDFLNMAHAKKAHAFAARRNPLLSEGSGTLH